MYMYTVWNKYLYRLIRNLSFNLLHNFFFDGNSFVTGSGDDIRVKPLVLRAGKSPPS